MSNSPTPREAFEADLKRAIRALSRHESGHEALRALQILAHGPSLDTTQQSAVDTIIRELYGSSAGTTRAMLWNAADLVVNHV